MSVKWATFACRPTDHDCPGRRLQAILRRGTRCTGPRRAAPGDQRAALLQRTASDPRARAERLLRRFLSHASDPGGMGPQQLDLSPAAGCPSARRAPRVLRLLAA